jgi:sugar phosphate isomerase/epimerase
MAPLAARHGITVSVEAQRSAEVNYLNHVAEVIAIIRAVNQQHIRVLADCYHMAVMGDAPADVAAAQGLIGLVEIAEQANRTVPGVAGDDFRPYFRALRQAGYQGPITIEGDGTPAQIRTAFATLAAQASESM